jgi:transcriptional regulator with XRE-family HTH domain
MANDHLKIALTRAGLTAEQFADIISVDPKTVQRWVGGRTPYARHRDTISRALDIPEHELWPDTVPPPPAPVFGAETHPAPDSLPAIGAWASLDTDGALNPVALLTDDVKQVDLLDSFDTLLGIPGVARALDTLASRGCQIRGMVPNADTWPVPSIAERLGMRTLTTTVPHHVLLRADGTLMLGLLLLDGEPPPLFVVNRETSPGIYERLLAHLDNLWDQADPMDTLDATATNTPPNSPPATAIPGSAPSSGSSLDDEQPPRRWPRRPS